MLLNRNEDALAPIIEVIRALIEQLHDGATAEIRETTLTLVLLALGDALMAGHSPPRSGGMAPG